MSDEENMKQIIFELIKYIQENNIEYISDSDYESESEYESEDYETDVDEIIEYKENCGFYELI